MHQHCCLQSPLSLFLHHRDSSFTSRPSLFHTLICRVFSSLSTTSPGARVTSTPVSILDSSQLRIHQRTRPTGPTRKSLHLSRRVSTRRPCPVGFGWHCSPPWQTAPTKALTVCTRPQAELDSNFDREREFAMYNANMDHQSSSRSPCSHLQSPLPGRDQKLSPHLSNDRCHYQPLAPHPRHQRQNVQLASLGLLSWRCHSCRTMS